MNTKYGPTAYAVGPYFFEVSNYQEKINQNSYNNSNKAPTSSSISSFFMDA